MRPADGESEIPIWNWYWKNNAVHGLVRAARMLTDFTWVGAQGGARGAAGDWLVEHPDGSHTEVFADPDFGRLFTVFPNPRPEKITQPEALIGPNQPGAPKKESI